MTFVFFYFLKVASISPRSLRGKPFPHFEIDIPKQYNFFEEYSICKFLPFEEVGCSANHAQGPLLSLSHRFCRLLSQNVQLSLQYLSACDPLSHGCENGHMRSLFYLFEQNGVTEYKCHPWENILNSSAEFCSKCKNGSTLKLYKTVLGSTQILENINEIKEEIYLRGPVAAAVNDLSHFLNDTLIEGSNGNRFAAFTAEIIGWTEKQGHLAWIVDHPKWGVRYVRAGYNDMLIESGVFAAIPVE